MEQNLLHFLSSLIAFKAPDKFYWTHNTMKTHLVSQILMISCLVQYSCYFHNDYTHTHKFTFALIPLITDYFYCYH